jgi:hypothetical protein
LTEPKRAVDAFGALFSRPISDGLLGMATGEAIAHLNYLAANGRAIRTRDAPPEFGGGKIRPADV